MFDVLVLIVVVSVCSFFLGYAKGEGDAAARAFKETVDKLWNNKVHNRIPPLNPYN